MLCSCCARDAYLYSPDDDASSDCRYRHLPFEDYMMLQLLALNAHAIRYTKYEQEDDASTPCDALLIRETLNHAAALCDDLREMLRGR